MNRDLIDYRWWQKKFEPLGCTVVGWSYRTSALIRLPSGASLSVDRKILELMDLHHSKK